VGSMRPPAVRFGASTGGASAGSEDKGTRLVDERATFRSDARRSAPGANRRRPSDRPEAAPLPWGADPEVRAHALDRRERAGEVAVRGRLR